MRNFRIVAMAYEETTPENERIIKKITASLVMKIEYPDETIIHFPGHFDEEKIKEKLEQVSNMVRNMSKDDLNNLVNMLGMNNNNQK